MVLEPSVRPRRAATGLDFAAGQGSFIVLAMSNTYRAAEGVPE
jgi:hypothetical protein